MCLSEPKKRCADIGEGSDIPCFPHGQPKASSNTLPKKLEMDAKEPGTGNPSNKASLPPLFHTTCRRYPQMIRGFDRGT